jgi:hypothetical protein
MAAEDIAVRVAAKVVGSLEFVQDWLAKKHTIPCQSTDLLEGAFAIWSRRS